MRSTLQEACYQSRTSGTGARIMAMQMASDNAKNLLEDLQLEYNKLRQQGITNRIARYFGWNSQRHRISNTQIKENKIQKYSCENVEMESFKNYITSFWKGLWSLLVGMKVTGKEFVTPKVTEQYPENRKDFKDR